MNIITRYQANELSKLNFAEINAKVFELLKEEYDVGRSTKKVVDFIFDKIRSDSADGLFESLIDISFEGVDNDVDYYKDYGTLIERSLNHLGYVVDSIPLGHELRLFISWGE